MKWYIGYCKTTILMVSRDASHDVNNIHNLLSTNGLARTGLNRLNSFNEQKV